MSIHRIHPEATLLPSRTLFAVVCCLSLQVQPSLTRAADSWPQFRGPTGDGIAQQQSPPIEFSEAENVSWRTPLPGRGWSSPVVKDGKIWVTTAVENVPTEAERLELLRKTGTDEKKFGNLAIAASIDLKLLTVDLHSGSLTDAIDLTTIEQPDAIHSLNSYASPTPVIDGPNIYCHFGTYGTFCVERATGQIVWRRVLPLKHSVGPGSSPFVHGELLVLIQDGLEQQYVTALDKRSGKTVWKTDRPPMDASSGEMKKSYCTPIAITDSAGRKQLICMGSQWMVSYDPRTGSELWRLRHGTGFSVVPRPVFQDDVVYFATGFGKPQLWAVRVDGVGDVTETHVLWTVRKGIPAKPSPLLHNGLLYVVDDSGVASCIDAQDGDLVWKQRLGGTFSASPTLAGGHLYFGNHDGKVFVIESGQEGRIVAENQLGGQIMASPAVVDDALIVRTADAIYRIEQS